MLEKFSALKKSIKDHYLSEQDFTCFFCRQQIRVANNRAWDTEHLLARTTYPNFMFEPRNLCVTCPDCNNEKSSKNILSSSKPRKKFPEKSNAYRIAHPHIDNYFEHIRPLIKGLLYMYLTDKGRATIRIYGLDRFQKISGRSSSYDPKLYKLLLKVLLENSSDASFDLIRFLLTERADALGAENYLEIMRLIP